jgi:arabinogalactan oligomer/maltooligosaccharide transport system substrate-binding protein
MKKCIILLFLLVLGFGLFGCDDKDDKIKLTVWGAEEDQIMLTAMIEAFKTEYASEAEFEITLGVQSESTAKDTVIQDVEAAADVYAFADDQLEILVKAGALQEVVLNADAIRAANNAGSIAAATYNGKLYAYPMTADNGYFMFYNKQYFTEEDVERLDAMLDAAKNHAGKKVTFPMKAGGWYLYAFFAGAGLSLSLNEDGSNACNWNATNTTYTGVDVVKAILAAVDDGLYGVTDAEFSTGVKEGVIIAGVSGTWNAQIAMETWGENYAAVKLPTFTLKGQQVQMSSFSGYKLVGVNPNSKNTGWAMKLAEWLTNEQNQVLRFEMRSLGPSNINAARSEEVLATPHIAALAAQSAYATVQRVGNNFWSPTETFGLNLTQGSAYFADFADKGFASIDAYIQDTLNTMVAGITAPLTQD